MVSVVDFVYCVFSFVLRKQAVIMLGIYVVRCCCSINCLQNLLITDCAKKTCFYT